MGEAATTTSSGTVKAILITGASTGFGASAARQLALKGHIVFAGVRSHEVAEIKAAESFAREKGVALRPITLDVTSQKQVDDAVSAILCELQNVHHKNCLDVVIHNAGQGTIGPAESFTPEEMMTIFDVNVLGAQRLNRAVLPHLRKERKGLLIWTSSSSTRGGTPPFMGPYFCSKAAMDSLAVTYSAELVKWGIETCIIVPGAFPAGTKHFDHMKRPTDEAKVAAQYLDGPYKGVPDRVVQGLKGISPADADPEDVARAIVRAVEYTDGKRPFRIHIDPCNDGAEEVSKLADDIRAAFLRRIGLEDVLSARL